jgi:hypothetical protein
MSPFTDPAFFISRLLFQHFPIPPTLDDIQSAVLTDETGAAAPNLIVDVMEVKMETAAKVQTLAADLVDKAQLQAKVDALADVDEQLHGLVPRFAKDEGEAEARLVELLDVVSAIFPADGSILLSRQPKEAWSDVAKLVFRLCTEVLATSHDLVANCSHKLQESGMQTSADVHPAAFLMPLLTYALTSLRYPQLSRWHKRLVWFTVQHLAKGITASLSNSLEVPSSISAILPSVSAIATKELHLIGGQPTALQRDVKDRLDGTLGSEELFLVGNGKGMAAHAFSSAPRSFAFDDISQAVLPWRSVDPKSLSRTIDEARLDLSVVPTLLALKQHLQGREPEVSIQAVVDAASELIEHLRRIEAATDALRTRTESAVATVLTISGKASKLLENASSQQRLDTVMKLRVELKDAVTFDQSNLEREIETWAIERLRANGMLSCVAYAGGQQLLVYDGSQWQQAAVVSDARVGSAENVLQFADEKRTPMALHPWNHAPLELPLADFEVMRSRHASIMCKRHASIIDALSGQRLDVFDQCIPIKIVGGADQADARLAEIADVSALADVLCDKYTARREQPGGGGRLGIILTAGPAAGKTCLISQLMMHLMSRTKSDLVPILIKVQELQRRLLTDTAQEVFARSWNWVDAFLQCVHGIDSAPYRMLRQALMARRALILLDGIDEGGKKREAIERHVTQVLAPQGHVMLVTSRPNGMRSFSRSTFCM